jgi:ABC-2 type transport system ATP-binding protein
VVIDVRGVSRRFGSKEALRHVSLEVPAGHICALLGPNGAGKTTLLRILAGLVDADEGQVRFMGVPTASFRGARLRQLVGLVPSGDRSFYLRISGLENLMFFGRLQGLRRAEAVARAWETLESVDLTESAKVSVGAYSHGMQKRLSVARALLMKPPIMLVDEATHDLDPDGARRIRGLVVEAAGRGTAVIWSTQRLDEIREFADWVTLLDRGQVRFAGTVPQLLAIAVVRSHLITLRNERVRGEGLERSARSALGPVAAISLLDDAEGEHFLMTLADGSTLGQAIARLQEAGIDLIACREERSEIEKAFLLLTEKGPS